MDFTHYRHIFIVLPLAKGYGTRYVPWVSPADGWDPVKCSNTCAAVGERTLKKPTQISGRLGGRSVNLDLNSVSREFEALNHSVVCHTAGLVHVLGPVATQRVLSALVGRKLNDTGAAVK